MPSHHRSEGLREPSTLLNATAHIRMLRPVSTTPSCQSPRWLTLAISEIFSCTD
jgi:hypothetical protein